MKFKTSLFITGALALSLFSFASNGHAEDIQFNDVKKESPIYETISWAVEKNLVKGYPDGTFKPNNVLTESQFAAIMSRYFNPTIEEGLDPTQWSNAHYDYLKKSGVLLPGHTDISHKNKVFTRLELAKAFFKSRGLTGSDKDVIDWMYENHITAGKGVSEDKYIDFGGQDGLKRAHVSAFFAKMDRLKFNIMASEIGKDELRGDALFNALLPLFQEKEFTLEKSSNGVITARSKAMVEGMPFSPRITIENTGDQLFIGNLTPTYQPSIELVSQTLIQFGIKEDVSTLMNEIYNFSTKKDPTKKSLTYGSYTINMEIITTFNGYTQKNMDNFVAYIQKKGGY
ncbi:S-layer homology domain-containing protein [Neobacillus sp. D3-1R]|uniref:S-layer homology domain-containing protein n=1 Tax=Neobacillus sp. D3-1R TaxID=3445778 RepID=UPI003FA0762C